MGKPQGGGNVLQGGGPNDTTVWFVDVGPFEGNGEDGRRGTHRFPWVDHREAIAEDRRRDVVDVWGGSSAVSGGK